MRHTRAAAAAVLSLAALLFAGPASACCARGFRICGPADGSGSGDVAVSFNVNNCTAAGSYTVTTTETAFEICVALQATLDGDCISPPVPGYSSEPCEFICYPDPSDAACAVLVDEKNCAICDVLPNPTTCCGITITEYAQPMQ